MPGMVPNMDRIGMQLLAEILAFKFEARDQKCVIGLLAWVPGSKS
jgi:hypothetical protein